MTVKKFIGKAHLWLGLSSGLLVCFLGITGCLLVFEKEIRPLFDSLDVAPQAGAYKLPSELKAAAEKHLDGRKVVGLEYPGRNKSALAYYYNADEYFIVALNPYTGAVLQVKNMNHDFFRVVTMGHYYLWLPPAIGQPIVASATLVFLLMLITGLVLWWPKNNAARKQRFSVKWNARWRRVNYDLHSVLGFYMTWVVIFIALTGLVMGFQWFSKSVYWITSGGEVAVIEEHPLSDTTKQQATTLNPADQIWLKYKNTIPKEGSASIYFANNKTDLVEWIVNYRPGTYYKQDVYHFDQHTLQEVPVASPYHGRYADVSTADKIARMNYDIHVGAIGGLPTKILAFFGSLIAASLPVTGFYIWWGRRKKARLQKPAAPKTATLVAVANSL